MSECLVDTNYVLRFLLDDIKDQAQKVRELFQNAKAGSKRVIVPLLVFVELNYILRKIYGFEKDKIIQQIFTLAEFPYLYIEKRDILLRALLLYRDRSVSFVDAIFVTEAFMGKKELLTFDRKLKKLLTATSG